MRFSSDSEIVEIVRAFESAAISRDNWKHAEHMIVALYYLETEGFVTACEKMKSGILNLLVAGFKVDLSKEMPYHETITRFWMDTLDQFRRSKPIKTLNAKANEMLEVFDKDYPLRFYSRAKLFSDEARVGYVPPDLESAP